jgi:hypothetical protein
LVRVNEGGGASKSTDPAFGSSTATDVSLREYVTNLIAGLDRHLTAEIETLRRETAVAHRNAEKAIDVAAREAAERLAAHNGLIDQMQAQQVTFAPRESLEDFKESYRKAHEELKDTFRQRLDDYKTAADQRFGRIERFQAMLIGGLVLVSFIGIANLVKVWAG